MAKVKTKKELESKLEALGDISLEQKKEVVCALVGHSNIEEYCFGYVSCSRCGTQIGDTLAGSYENKKQVVVGHNCETCRANYKKLNWRDTYLAPDPFTEEKSVEDILSEIDKSSE